MENASKALIMAGSVLIAMIVISLLVIFFGNLRGLKQTELTSEQVTQATEFNKQYDAYQRDIYGSEILSLANKIDDYNKIQAEDKGYQKIVLNVNITKDIDSENFKSGTYTSTMLRNKIKELDQKAKEIGNKTIKSKNKSNISRKISKLATMRTEEILDLGFETEQYQSLLAEYIKYKSLSTEIKVKKFQYVNFEYDDYTGRVITMNYKL